MWVHPDFNEETSQLHAVLFDPQHGHMHTWWRQEFPMQSEQQEGGSGDVRAETAAETFMMTIL